MFLSGQGVGFAAYRVEGGCDVQGGAGAGALEQQVLQEMGGAEHAGGFVAGADSHPEPDGYAAGTGHFFGNHAYATGQYGAAHLVTAYTLVDEAAVLVVELFGDGLKLDGQGNRHREKNLSTGTSEGKHSRPTTCRQSHSWWGG
ncbi:Uncharacterised protein [Mycobacterium tuberculosis]|nr:Uncharacterised protein [Mycobacterium tuberculosis]